MRESFRNEHSSQTAAAPLGSHKAAARSSKEEIQEPLNQHKQQQEENQKISTHNIVHNCGASCSEKVEGNRSWQSSFWGQTPSSYS